MISPQNKDFSHKLIQAVHGESFGDAMSDWLPQQKNKQKTKNKKTKKQKNKKKTKKTKKKPKPPLNGLSKKNMLVFWAFQLIWNKKIF